jgi:hypothetical protein
MVGRSDGGVGWGVGGGVGWGWGGVGWGGCSAPILDFAAALSTVQSEGAGRRGEGSDALTGLRKQCGIQNFSHHYHKLSTSPALPVCAYMCRSAC